MGANFDRLTFRIKLFAISKGADVGAGGSPAYEGCLRASAPGVLGILSHLSNKRFLEPASGNSLASRLPIILLRFPHGPDHDSCHLFLWFFPWTPACRQETAIQV